MSRLEYEQISDEFAPLLIIPSWQWYLKWERERIGVVTGDSLRAFLLYSKMSGETNGIFSRAARFITSPEVPHTLNETCERLLQT